MASPEALPVAAASALAVDRSAAAIPQAPGFVEIGWRGRPVQIEHQWLGDSAAGRPLIVFLHEGLGSVAMWRDFPQRLCTAAGCRGLVYSRPGYGRSSPRAADDAWGTDFLHQQALEVLPALLTALSVDATRDKPWLFGHSDGGTIALLYAAHRPDQLAGAVLLAPHIRVEAVSISSIQLARQAYQDTDLRARLARHHDNPDSAFGAGTTSGCTLIFGRGASRPSWPPSVARCWRSRASMTNTAPWIKSKASPGVCRVQNCALSPLAAIRPTATNPMR